MNSLAFAPGFADPVFSSQATFRAIMQALAEPGTVQWLTAELAPPAPLSPSVAAALLALADFETPVWVGSSLGTDAVLTYLKFHTGATIADQRNLSTFAAANSMDELGPLHDFAQGTLEYPDRSTTIFLDISADINLLATRLTGPGIEGERVLEMPSALLAQWAENRALFPCGVDLVLIRGQAIIGLPRSVRLAELEA